MLTATMLSLCNMNKQWTITDVPPQIGKRVLITGANSGIGSTEDAGSWRDTVKLKCAENGVEAKKKNCSEQAC
ncbi:hypothetical protein [Caballeronia udeis]|uniref:hypothetical protein n=1 Tax=Caballeronia udeis TaxID=1232866 RepID=UPI0012E8515F|nr:hypothetical protein [Caballeronia udeis]